MTGSITAWISAFAGGEPLPVDLPAGGRADLAPDTRRGQPMRVASVRSCSLSVGRSDTRVRMTVDGEKVMKFY